MKEKYFMAFGDVHGHYELMFRKARNWEKSTGKSLTALLCVGDMDPTFCDLRKKFDYPLSCLVDYQEQELRSPYPIIMVAGNNDDSFAYRQGEIAPDIYSLGRGGVLEFDGVSIGGISGVYKKEFFEEPPNPNILNGYPWYTYYNLQEISKLLLANPIDIFLTHDWFNWKTHEKKNPYTSRDLIKAIRPKYMFSGHLHDKAKTDESISQTRIQRLNRVHPSLEDYSYAFGFCSN